MTREGVITCMEIAQSAAFLGCLAVRGVDVKDAVWALLSPVLLVVLALVGVFQAVKWRLGWKHTYAKASFLWLLVGVACVVMQMSSTPE